MQPITRYAAVDFETFYDKEYSLRKMSTWAYVYHEKFDAYLVSVYDGGPIKWFGHPKDFDWNSLNGLTLLAHNASFDELVFRRLQEQGIIPASCQPAGWLCTADLAAYLRVKRDLATASKILLGRTMNKATRDKMKGKTRDEAIAAGMGTELDEYVITDAINCYDLFAQHGDKWPECEREYSQRLRASLWRGLPVDLPKAKAALDELVAQTHYIVRDIPWADDGPILSPKLLRIEGRKCGVPVPASLSKTDVKAMEWFDEYAPKFKWIAAVRDYRSINAHTNKIRTIVEGTRADGRLPLSIKYAGAHCTTGDTEVLTPTGWQRLDAWTGGPILQWDPSGKLEFLAARQLAFPGDSQELVSVRAPRISLDLTPGHRVPYYKHGAKAFDVLYAAELKARVSGTYIPTGGVFYNKDAEITPEQMRVLVAVQADGGWSTHAKHGRGLKFMIKKTRKKVRLRRILKEAAVNFREKEYPSHPGFTVFSVAWRDLPSWLTPERKRFGAWLLLGGSAAIEAAVEELPLWDGHRAAFSDTYYSSIRENVEWAATLAHLSGRSAGLLRSRMIRKTRLHSVVIRTKAATMVFGRHVTTAPPVDTVYCTETQTGFWLCRRDGKISVTGNSGRTSAGSTDDTGGSFNPLNMNRKALFGVDMRSLIVAPADKTLILADFCQIEAVMLPWIAGDAEGVRRIEETGSPYIAFAIQAGWAPEGATKESIPKDTYQFAKMCVLLCGYQGGPAKFKHAAKVMFGVEMTLEKAKELVAQWRAANPKIVEFWNEHNTWLRWSANHNDDTHEVALRSGRDLVYFEPRWHKDPERKYAEVKASVVRGIPPSKLYGGILVENLTQASARDVLRDARNAVERAGHDVILDVYDELVVLCPEDEAADRAKDISKLMTTSSPWAEGCPLSVECQISKFYKK